MIRPFAAALLIALAAPALAQSPPPVVAVDPAQLTKARRLMALLKVEEMTDAAMKSAMRQMSGGAMQQILSAVAPDAKLSARETEALSAGTTMMMREMETAMKDAMPGVIEASAQAYARNLTPAELDHLLAFYEAPLGRSFVAKTPAIMSDPAIQAAQADMMRRMTANLPALMEKMKAQVAASMAKK